MSGILLPGQDKEPAPSGKIEIAKGFSRSEPESEPVEETESQGEAPPAAEEGASAPPPAQAPRPQPPRQAGPGGQPEFAFPPSGAQVQCPGCGNPFTVPVFTIVDLGQNPELKGAILGNQINVASCPTCGAGGPLSAPLMVHDPENEFLGVFIPQTGGMNDTQAQRVIGDLTQTLMRQLPKEARRGYMLQPKQFFDWERFTEVLWETEGVTPEMLRRQREQAGLLQSLASLANDDTALEIAVARDSGLIDADFFAMLDRIIVMSGPPEDGADNALLVLRTYLLENTEAGAAVGQREERVRGLLADIGPSTSREEFLETLLTVWREDEGEQIVATLAVAAAPLLDYQFLMMLSERIEASEDDEERAELEQIRELVVEMQEQQRQNQAANAQQVQAVLQEVLQSQDPATTLRQHADYIDERFLSLLAANIQTAEERNATAAVARLRQIYDMAVSIVQENLPDDIRLMNQLLMAPDQAAMRALLKENRQLVNRDLVDSMTTLEAELRQSGQTELADRLKSVRAQVSLMV